MDYDFVLIAEIVLAASDKVPLPITIIVLLLGGFIFLVSILSFVKARTSKSWPTTLGQVISSELKEKRRRKGGVMYNAAVAFDYSVEGTKYTGNKVRFGSSGNSNPNPARQILNRYPVNKQVTVYYNPRKPEESVLESNLSINMYIGLIVGTAVFAIGIVLLVRHFNI